MTPGPLQTDNPGRIYKNTIIMSLPAGFSYRVISTHGQTMDDGYKLPDKPDGMATSITS